MLPMPTAPIAAGPERADDDRVDDAHRHPADLGEHDRARQREHRPQFVAIRHALHYISSSSGRQPGLI